MLPKQFFKLVIQKKHSYFFSITEKKSIKYILRRRNPKKVKYRKFLSCYK